MVLLLAPQPIAELFAACKILQDAELYKAEKMSIEPATDSSMTLIGTNEWNEFNGYQQQEIQTTATSFHGGNVCGHSVLRGVESLDVPDGR